MAKIGVIGEMEYPLDWEAVERLKKHYGEKAELVWMSPDEFLSKVPHPLTSLVSAAFDLRAKFFSETSLGYIRKAFLERIKLDPLVPTFRVAPLISQYLPVAHEFRQYLQNLEGKMPTIEAFYRIRSDLEREADQFAEAYSGITTAELEETLRDLEIGRKKMRILHPRYLP